MPRTRRQGVVLSEEQPRSPRARLLGRVFVGVLAIAVAGAAYVGFKGSGIGLGSPRCQASTSSTTVDYEPEQMNNAATIVGIAMKRGLPARAATIAIATALQESKLRNLRYGDRDSLGLFQQRPSQGWGSEAQLLDTEYATNAFYDALVKIKGYEAMEITKVAQEVQRSAAPEAYADHEQEGRVLADTISGYTAGGLGCRLADTTAPGTPATLQGTLVKELGITGSVSGRTVTVSARDARHAWAIGAWSVAKAEQFGVTSVVVAGKEWKRTRGSSGYDWSTADHPAAATAVTITFA